MLTVDINARNGVASCGNVTEHASEASKCFLDCGENSYH
jgi:hypothetical protein